MPRFLKPVLQSSSTGRSFAWVPGYSGPLSASGLRRHRRNLRQRPSFELLLRTSLCAHRDQSRTQVFEEAQSVAAAAASTVALGDDALLPRDDSSHPPSSAHHAWQRRSFDCVYYEGATPVGHREETGVYRVEKFASDVEMLCYLGETVDDGGDPPACFCSPHW